MEQISYSMAVLVVVEIIEIEIERSCGSEERNEGDCRIQAVYI